MYKSLNTFGHRFQNVSVIKRCLTDQSNQKNISSDRIFTIQNLNEFQEKIMKSDSPIIVNFSAAWCHNCTMLSPIIESIVRDHSRRIVLFKVDVEKHMDLALEYGVSAIPCLLGVNRGQVRSSLIGIHGIEKIQKWVDDFLKKA